MNQLLRVDFIFSYWVFIWYLLYIFRITNYNPLFALYLGLFENLFTIGLMLYNRSKYTILFLINVLLFKGIPIYTLRKLSFSVNDVFRTILLFCIYLFWVRINDVSILDLGKKHILSLINDKNETPFMFMLNKLYRK